MCMHSTICWIMSPLPSFWMTCLQSFGLPEYEPWRGWPFRGVLSSTLWHWYNAMERAVPSLGKARSTGIWNNFQLVHYIIITSCPHMPTNSAKIKRMRVWPKLFIPWFSPNNWCSWMFMPPVRFMAIDVYGMDTASPPFVSSWNEDCQPWTQVHPTPADPNGGLPPDASRTITQGDPVGKIGFQRWIVQLLSGKPTKSYWKWP